MTVIVGLGNPGRAYVGTRHNVGWMVVERLAARHQAVLNRRVRRRWRVVAVAGDFKNGERVVRVFKPSTMMNRSGEALAVLRGVVAPEDVLLVCDDVNLPLGRLRLRAQGSSGGHHGLQSCFEGFGTERLARLRIGIGGGDRGADLTRVVLSTFTQEERPLLEEMTGRAVEAVETWIEKGVEVAMNRYNTAQER